MSTRLEARVKAKNRVNEIANRLEKELKEIFRPYVGKKILIQSGDFIKEIKEKLAKYNYPDNKEFHIYKKQLNYILCFEVSVSEQNSNFSCCYAKTGVRVGKINGNTLVEIDTIDEVRRTDYTAKEIELLRIEARKKEDELNAIKNKYRAFGEHDYGNVED